MSTANTTKIYVGVVSSSIREVFRSSEVPTQETHGTKYRAVIGPFKTKRGAEFLAKYGHGSNPHLQTVNDAERAAKQLANQAI
jgi:hypothetical protein